MKTGRQLTEVEFHNLTCVVQKCADAAITQAKEAVAKQRAYEGSYISDEWFNRLFDCYCNSDYAENLSVDYKNYVRDQASIHLQYGIGQYFKDANLHRIMVPVLFYMLILRHENNQGTVKRRKNKLLEAELSEEPAPEWKRINIFQNDFPEYFVNEKAESSFSKILADNRALQEECNYYENPLISHKLKQATALSDKIEGHLHYLKYCSDTARMGIFFHNVLNLPEDENHALNTILRMECADSLSSIISRCKVLSLRSREEYKGDRKIPDFSKILWGYGVDKTKVIPQKADVIYPVPVFYIGENDDPHLYETLHAASNKQDAFTFLYDYLKNNFRFETEDIIDVVVDKKILTRFISSDELIPQFIKANKKIMRLLASINDISNEIDDLITVGQFFVDNEDSLRYNAYIHDFPSWEAEHEYYLTHEDADFEEMLCRQNEEDQEAVLPEQTMSVDEAIAQFIDSLKKVFSD